MLQRYARTRDIQNQFDIISIVHSLDINNVEMRHATSLPFMIKYTY